MVSQSELEPMTMPICMFFIVPNFT
jgi:hypothetical protein